MKLGTVRSSDRDGKLVIVSKNNRKWTSAEQIAPSLRLAVENWSEVLPKLEELYNKLNLGQVTAQDVKEEEFLSPLPRAFQWIDGSTFIQHIKLVRKSRKAPLPETLTTVPLVYQGAGDSFLAPTEDIPQSAVSHGTDFEGEVAVVVDDVPMGVSIQEAYKHIILFLLVNDVSLRAIALEEFKKRFWLFTKQTFFLFCSFCGHQRRAWGQLERGAYSLASACKF